jgi:hypothetical protein
LNGASTSSTSNSTNADADTANPESGDAVDEDASSKNIVDADADADMMVLSAPTACKEKIILHLFPRTTLNFFHIEIEWLSPTMINESKVGSQKLLILMQETVSVMWSNLLNSADAYFILVGCFVMRYIN